MKIFYNNKGKVCGFMKDKIYYKEVDSRKHLMKIYNAYAISEVVVNQICGECNYIRLREKDTKKIYKVDMQTFYNKSFIKYWDDKQYFLPLKYWILEDNTLKLF